MQAFVQVAKTPEHLGFNTQPMDRDAAVKHANEVAKGGRATRVFRAAPVTPELTPREMLERHESFVTSDLLASFDPVIAVLSWRSP